jgi:acetylornithine deacetylase/succinyl-diaminopimelate desuccinylase-like protein
MTGPVTPVDFIRRLVAFDTSSSKSNPELILFVADVLGGQGIEPQLLPSVDGTKASLIATIGPDVPGGVALSGHTDVVPVTDQAWTDDPFTVVERDGRLHGRGTADMKSFIAVALALSLTGQNRSGSVPFASAAGIFQRAGIPAVVCDPGSPTQAHRPDELVTLDQVNACITFLRRLTDWAEQR